MSPETDHSTAMLELETELVEIDADLTIEPECPEIDTSDEENQQCFSNDLALK